MAAMPWRGRILVAGEADVAHFALHLGAIQRLDHPALGEMAFGIVVIHAFVHLPQVQMVGVQTSQRLLELAHRHFRIAPVRAHLGHQEHRRPAVANGAAHATLALAVVVLPRVVEEVDPGIDGGVGDPHRLRHRLDQAQVVATEAQDGDRVGMPAERSTRYLCGLATSRSSGHGRRACR